MNITQKLFSQIRDQTPVLTKLKLPIANVPIVTKLTSASAKETFDKQSLSQLEGLIHQEIQKTVEVVLVDCLRNQLYLERKQQCENLLVLLEEPASYVQKCREGQLFNDVTDSFGRNSRLRRVEH